MIEELLIELEEKIESKKELLKLMEGRLYSSIVMNDIAKLNQLWKEINRGEIDLQKIWEYKTGFDAMWEEETGLHGGYYEWHYNPDYVDWLQETLGKQLTIHQK